MFVVRLEKSAELFLICDVVIPHATKYYLVHVDLVHVSLYPNYSSLS